MAARLNSSVCCATENLLVLLWGENETSLINCSSTTKIFSTRSLTPLRLLHIYNNNKASSSTSPCNKRQFKNPIYTTDITLLRNVTYTTKNSGDQVKGSEGKKGHAEEDSPDYIEDNDTETNQEDEKFYLCKV